MSNMSNMTVLAKLMKVHELVSDGYTFLGIRFMFEDIQREIERGNPYAIQFGIELSHVLTMCEKAATKDLLVAYK